MRLLAPAPRGGGYAPVRTDTREQRPINTRGYRDLERTIPRPEGVRRLVCLGDSFTWGIGVLFDDTWPQRVERLLARERGERWEAVNLGEPGLNTVQEAAKLASEGFAYQPDVVVVGYVLNDSEDENAAEARRASEWLLDRREARAARRPLDRSALVRLVRGGFRRPSRTAAASTASARCTRTTTRGGRPAAGRCARSPACAASAACRSWSRSSRCSATRSTTATRSRRCTPRWRRPRPRRAPASSTSCRTTGASTGSCLTVDGADDEHPNEVAYRIASQAIARAVDDVVPRQPGSRRP